jgi:hypothetical protein
MKKLAKFSALLLDNRRRDQNPTEREREREREREKRLPYRALGLSLRKTGLLMGVIIMFVGDLQGLHQTSYSLRLFKKKRLLK